MALCPYCKNETEIARDLYTHKGAYSVLKCGHTPMKNPDRGTGLEWEVKEAYDQNLGTIVRRRIATKIDDREFVINPEDQPTVDPEILVRDDEVQPTNEELFVELPGTHASPPRSATKPTRKVKPQTND